jgi:hypothetical protein
MTLSILAKPHIDETASFQSFGIANVAVAALCFNYQMFGLEYYFGDVNYRLSAHFALEDFIRSTQPERKAREFLPFGLSF